MGCMINANELRLFNQIDTPIGYQKVKGFTVISKDDIIIMTGNGGGYYDAKLCNGVILTPEILELFGFEYHAPLFCRGAIKLAKNTVRDGSGNYDGFCMKTHIEGTLIPLVIRALHQLQNIYQDITGEELNVKL